MSIDYSEKIPNNVNLAGNRTLQRALEHWQPEFLNWWADMGPDGTEHADVYLRTAVSVEPKGWAHFDYVKMPDYRWGIFLAPAEAGPQGELRRAQGRARVAGSAGRIPREPPPPDRHAGRHRARVGRAAAPSRPHLPVALRSAQPVPGQRRGRPAPVGDGVPAARPLRPRRPRGGGGAARAPLRRRRQSAHPRRVQRAHARLAVVLHVHVLHRPRRQVPALLARGVGLRSARAHLPLHADRGSPPHVRRRVRHRPHRAAHVRGDGRAQDGRRRRSCARRA